MAGIVVAFLLSSGARAGDISENFPPSFAPPSRTNADAVLRAVSPSRRIIVTGGEVGENAELALAAEDALERAEGLLGFEVPFTRMDPIRIALVQVDGMENGQVVGAQAWTDRQLVQRIYVANADRVDQEDLLEAFCRLVVNRCIIFRLSAEDISEPLISAPDWLGVGIAQNLYSALRARNAEIMADEWRAGRNPSLAEVLELRRLPAGRCGEKAATGLAVGLLLAQPDRSKLFSCLLDHIAMQGSGSGLDILQNCDSVRRSRTAWEKEWDVWVAAQGELLRVAYRSPAEFLEKLRAALEIAPMDLGLPEERNIPSQLTPEGMIAWRYEPFMASLAKMVGFRVRALAIGQGPEFGEVAEAYGRYFDALSFCACERGLRRKLFARRRERALRRLLVDAREKHKQLEVRLTVESGGAREVFRPDQAAEGMRRFFTRHERVPVREIDRSDTQAAGP